MFWGYPKGDAGSPGCALTPAGRAGQPRQARSTRQGQQGARKGSAACTMAGGAPLPGGLGTAEFCPHATYRAPNSAPPWCEVLRLWRGNVPGCCATGCGSWEGQTCCCGIIPRVNGVSLFLSVLLPAEKAGRKSVEKNHRMLGSGRDLLTLLVSSCFTTK